MPIDIAGRKPHEIRIAEQAAETETYGPVFGSGCIETISRKFVNELRDIAANEELSSAKRRAALEKLERFAQQGSKFCQQALGELGYGVRTGMGEKQFARTLENLNLDDKTRRKIAAMGPQFLQYVSDLLLADSPDTRMQLRDLADRVGGETAEALVIAFNDAESEQICTDFVNANPDYYCTDDNYRTLLDHISNVYLHADSSQVDDDTLLEDLLSRGFLTVENLTQAFYDLNQAGLMEQPEGTVKPLSADDRQALNLTAAAVRTESDIGRFMNQYLLCALQGRAPVSWEQIKGNTEYYDVLVDAVIFLFAQKRADYIPSEGAEAYLRQYLAGRFPTLPLLDAAWDRCKVQTDGHGLVTEAEAIVEQEQQYQDASLNELNDRFTVRK